MIGGEDCAEELQIINKIKSLDVNDIYDIPNVFQVSQTELCIL